MVRLLCWASLQTTMEYRRLLLPGGLLLLWAGWHIVPTAPRSELKKTQHGGFTTEIGFHRQPPWQHYISVLRQSHLELQVEVCKLKEHGPFFLELVGMILPPLIHHCLKQ